MKAHHYPKVRMISAGAEDGLQNHWGRDAQRLDSAFCTIYCYFLTRRRLLLLFLQDMSSLTTEEGAHT
jgi:hypothetical protein